MRDRLLFPLKRLAGALPGVPEIYWRWTHDRLDPYPDFKLDKLAAALPAWCQAVERQSRGLEAEPPKRIAIFAFLHWWIAHAASLGLVLRALGHDVTLFGLSYRDWWIPNEPFYLRQRGAYLRDVMALGKAQIPFVDLTTSQGGGLPHELEDGMAAQSEIDVQYTLQREDLDFDRHEDQAALYALRLARNRRVAGALSRWFARERYDALIVPNGSILEFGAAYRVAKTLGIPVMTYEFGEQRQRVWLAQDDEVMRHNTEALWRALGDRPLSPAQADRLRNLYAARQGGKLWENFARQWQAAPPKGSQRLREELGLDPHRPVVLLATNVVGDSLALGRQVFSKGMADWLEQTARFFAERPQAQLVVRVHPGELLSAGQPSVEILESALPELPDHVVVIPPEAKINTYDLMDLASFGLVYTTTVGMEMAMRGVPVIVAGQTHYRGKGFTLDPESWEEYFALIDRQLTRKAPERLDGEQMERAWRYAYLFFFEFPRPYPWHLRSMWEDFEQTPMEAVLTPEGIAPYRETFRALAGEPLRWDG